MPYLFGIAQGDPPIATSRNRIYKEAIEAVMKATLGKCRVHDLTLRDTVNALSLCARHRFSFCDAVIVASALRADCTTLWSEDFQHGVKLQGRLTVRNPFKPD
jgi:predicted nucleic acid-binding protein